MTHAVITVEFDPRTRADLALPLNIPNQALADAVAEALEVDKDGNANYTLAIKTEQGVVSISPHSTLGDAGVLDGFYLYLRRAEGKLPAQDVSRSKPYLRAISGETFSIDADTILIGRRDVKRGVVVDIDLAPLDSHKIISRRHATVECQKGKWMLIDNKSVNGTWLNGHQLTAQETYPLQEGDEIIFGRNGVILKFYANR